MAEELQAFVSNQEDSQNDESDENQEREQNLEEGERGEAYPGETEIPDHQLSGSICRCILFLITCACVSILLTSLTLFFAMIFAPNSGINYPFSDEIIQTVGITVMIQPERLNDRETVVNNLLQSLDQLTGLNFSYSNGNTSIYLEYDIPAASKCTENMDYQMLARINLNVLNTTPVESVIKVKQSSSSKDEAEHFPFYPSEAFVDDSAQFFSEEYVNCGTNYTRQTNIVQSRVSADISCALVAAMFPELSSSDNEDLLGVNITGYWWELVNFGWLITENYNSSCTSSIRLMYSNFEQASIGVITPPLEAIWKFTVYNQVYGLETAIPEQVENLVKSISSAVEALGGVCESDSSSTQEN